MIAYVLTNRAGLRHNLLSALQALEGGVPEVRETELTAALGFHTSVRLHRHRGTAQRQCRLDQHRQHARRKRCMTQHLPAPAGAGHRLRPSSIGSSYLKGENHDGGFIRSRHDPSTQTRAHNRFLIKLTVISTLGGLLFGYDTGVISGALLYMKDDLELTTTQEALVVSALLFPGAALGALLGGKLADALGRKGSLLVCAGLVPGRRLGLRRRPELRGHAGRPDRPRVSASAPRPRPARCSWPRWPRRTAAAGWSPSTS